jgi:excisionase family DNA binding protein
MHITDIKQQSLSRNTTNSVSVKQGALKLKDACTYLGGISPSSVRRLIDQGRLRPNRALRHILIPIAELDRFINSGGPQ